MSNTIGHVQVQKDWPPPQDLTFEASSATNRSKINGKLQQLHMDTSANKSDFSSITAFQQPEDSNQYQNSSENISSNSLVPLSSREPLLLFGNNTVSDEKRESVAERH